MKPHPPAPAREAEAGGVVLLLALLLCLGCAVLIVGLSNALLVGERVARGETGGRDGLRQENAALAELSLQALLQWLPQDATLTDGTVGRLSLPPDANPWRLRGTVVSAWRGPEGGTPGTAGAIVERGRDGLDLPLAGLVASTITLAPGRSAAEAVTSSAAEAVPVGVVESGAAALDGAAVALRPLSEPWRLGATWELALTGPPADTGIQPVDGTHVLTGRPGTRVRLPEPLQPEADAPFLVVVLGGADLDARDRGPLDGVLVVDDGGVDLEGTQLRGAVLCSEDVDLGATGSLTWMRSHLRWATDRSLRRVRLVPGTREETWGAPG